MTAPAMRAVLAFALSACEAEGVEPWAIETSNGARQLRVVIANDGDTAAADRLAAALGVTDPLVRRQPSSQPAGGVIYTVGSKTPRQSWHKPDRPDYFGESVPFDGRLIEVTVIVYNVEDES